jgi:hypothetical protein
MSYNACQKPVIMPEKSNSKENTLRVLLMWHISFDTSCEQTYHVEPD